MDPALFFSFDRRKRDCLEIASVVQSVSRPSCPIVQVQEIQDACIVVVLTTKKAPISDSVAHDIALARANRKGLFALLLPRCNKAAGPSHPDPLATSYLLLHGHHIVAFQWTSGDGPERLVSWARSMHPREESVRLHRQSPSPPLIPGTYVL